MKDLVLHEQAAQREMRLVRQNKGLQKCFDKHILRSTSSLQYNTLMLIKRFMKNLFMNKSTVGTYASQH